MNGDGTLNAQAYGVRFAVRWSGLPDSVIRGVLPPHSVPLPAVTAPDFTVSVRARGHTWQVLLHQPAAQHPSPTEASYDTRAEALGATEKALAMQVGLSAADLVFVHAGAVGLGDVALVLPGPSYAGKSTLVHALVQRGATYLSDEFAVLDASGRVHSYPRAISLRTGAGRRSVALAAAAKPLPVGAIGELTYRPQAVFETAAMPADQAALGLIANCLTARIRPAEVLHTTALAARTATVAFRGTRGDAAVAADQLLDLLRGCH